MADAVTQPQPLRPTKKPEGDEALPWIVLRSASAIIQPGMDVIAALVIGGEAVIQGEKRVVANPGREAVELATALKTEQPAMYFYATPIKIRIDQVPIQFRAKAME